MVLFEADRGAVFLRQPDGSVDRARSAAACRRATSAHVRDFPARLAAGRGRRRRAGRCSPSTTATTRAAEDVRAAVVQEGFDTICTAPLLRRRRAARPAQRLPRPAAPLVRRRPRDDGRPRGPGERRDPRRPGLRADGDLGRPAPVDPAARRAAEPPVRRPRDRHGHRHRAPPAHRLPQRPRLPAGRRPTSSRSRCRARSASTSTRPRTSSASRSARASPAGWPSTASPRTSATRPSDPRGRHHPGHRGPTSTSRCCSRR